MTVPTTSWKTGPTPGDGATSTYTFAFRILELDDLVVTVYDYDATSGISSNPTILTRGATDGYTVSDGAAGAPSGGQITLTGTYANLAADKSVEIKRDTRATQLLDIGNQNFRPDSFEDEYDRNAMRDQELEGRVQIIEDGELPGEIVTALPTASATYHRRFVWLYTGAAAEQLYTCLRNSDGTFTWVMIGSGYY